MVYSTIPMYPCFQTVQDAIHSRLKSLQNFVHLGATKGDAPRPWPEMFYDGLSWIWKKPLRLSSLGGKRTFPKNKRIIFDYIWLGHKPLNQNIYQNMLCHSWLDCECAKACERVGEFCRLCPWERTGWLDGVFQSRNHPEGARTSGVHELRRHWK